MKNFLKVCLFLIAIPVYCQKDLATVLMAEHTQALTKLLTYKSYQLGTDILKPALKGTHEAEYFNIYLKNREELKHLISQAQELILYSAVNQNALHGSEQNSLQSCYIIYFSPGKIL